ncbi:MAG: helix-turn-helix transcriptional regulator [Fimbriimonadaceae bacterium]|nr:helix-turn-helix transcriptional regulator [Fimbriimonadaceae bacterium]
MSAEEASELLRALADPIRLRLLSLLRSHGTLCVCELEAVTGEAQYTVSRHLGLLRRAGLVAGRRSGARIDYSLRGDLSAGVLATLEAAVGLLADDPHHHREQAAAAALRQGCCRPAA